MFHSKLQALPGIALMNDALSPWLGDAAPTRVISNSIVQTHVG